MATMPKQQTTIALQIYGAIFASAAATTFVKQLKMQLAREAKAWAGFSSPYNKSSFRQESIS